MEKIYKSMRNSGVGSLISGILIITAGLSLGIYMIVIGGVLLRRKEDLMF